jgi:WD40 repeat protein
MYVSSFWNNRIRIHHKLLLFQEQNSQQTMALLHSISNMEDSCCSPQDEVVLLLPAHVIGRSIGSFLDRHSWNALRLTSREVWRSMEGMNRPWPEVRLSSVSSSYGSKPSLGGLGIQSMAFSGDGSTFACRNRGGSIRVWNRNNGQQMKEWSSPGPFSFANLTFSPDNQVLACDGSGKSLRLYDVSSGACLQSFRGHQGAITSIAFAPPSSTTLSFSNRQQLLASGSTDSTVRIWNHRSTASGSTSSTDGQDEELAVLNGHLGAIYSIAISSDGRFLASGGTDRILRVWNLDKIMNNTQKDDFCQGLKGHEMTIVEVAFSNKNNSQDLLLSASLDMTVRLWSQQQQQQSRQRPPKQRRADHDGDGGQQVVASFTCLRVLQLDAEALTMKICADGNLLAVGMSTDLIHVWNLNDLIENNGDDCDAYPEGEYRQQHLPPVSTIPGKLVSFAPRIVATSGKDGFIQLLEI